MYTVITTVGTSLITNSKDEKVTKLNGKSIITDQDLESLDKLSSEEVLKGQDQTVKKLEKKLDKWIKRFKKDKKGNWIITKDEYNEDCCAEIKTLMEFYKNINNEENCEIKVYLIITDTARSALASKIIKENISNYNSNIKVAESFVVKGLQTDDYQKFENEGINHLFEILEKKIINAEYKNKNKIFNKDKTIINISGGYKVIIPYMTIFAQVYGIKSIYIYEDSSSIVTIPALPLQIDWAFAEKYYPYLSESTIIENKEKQEYLEEIGLLKYERGKYKKTSLGNFFSNAIERELHVSRAVMGYFFEYKFYEYFITHIYQDKYKVVKHSEITYEDEKPSNDVEIDLILSTGKENDKDYIAIEVKTLNDLKSLKVLSEQIERQLNVMKNTHEFAKEYHLCFYTPNNDMFEGLSSDNNNNCNSQKEKIRELSKLFENLPIEKFKVFIIKANYQLDMEERKNDKGMKNSNPYQQLMKDKLEYNKNFKEIKF